MQSLYEPLELFSGFVQDFAFCNWQVDHIDKCVHNLPRRAPNCMIGYIAIANLNRQCIHLRMVDDFQGGFSPSQLGINL